MKSKERDFIEKVRKKQEFNKIPDELILSELNKLKVPLSSFTKDQKLIVSEVRKKLRTLTGQFLASHEDRLTLLKQGKINDLLLTHASTKERLEIYPELKKIISSLKPKSILDLASGLNPLVLAKKEINYTAVDIRGDELALIESFFKKNKITGKTLNLDLREKKSLEKLPKADLCLIFKTLDLLDEKGHSCSEHLIKSIRAKSILISFPTKKLSGKKMNRPRRTWLEKMLTRLDFSFEVFNFENEIFYLAKKNPSSS